MTGKMISLQLQKSTDVDDKYPVFELTADTHPLLGVGATDDGVAEVYLFVDGRSWSVEYEQFLNMLQRARHRVQEEIDEETKEGKD